jgi:hypothetical protein
MSKQPNDFALPAPPVEVVAFVLFCYFFASVAATAVIQARLVDRELAACAITIFVSQGLLLAIWVGMGQATFPLRLLLAMAWSAWTVVVVTRDDARNIASFAAICVLVLFTAAVFGLVKLLGYRLVRDEPPSLAAAIADGVTTTGSLTPRQPRVQFSVAHLFGWVFAAAVMSAFLRLMQLPLAGLIDNAIIVGVLGLIGSANLWAILGGAHVGWRVLVPFCMTMLLTVISGDHNFFWPSILLTAQVAVVLALFRGAGYRAVRIGRLQSAGRR